MALRSGILEQVRGNNIKVRTYQNQIAFKAILWPICLYENISLYFLFLLHAPRIYFIPDIEV